MPLPFTLHAVRPQSGEGYLFANWVIVEKSQAFEHLLKARDFDLLVFCLSGKTPLILEPLAGIVAADGLHLVA